MNAQLKPNAIIRNSIYPVYAGASFENVLYRIPIIESIRMIEKAIAKGKDKIIFSNADEALQPHSIQMAHRIIDLIDYMPFNSWYMLTSSLDGEESYKNLCSIMRIEPKMNIISGHRFENVIKDNPEMVDQYKKGKDRFNVFINNRFHST